MLQGTFRLAGIGVAHFTGNVEAASLIQLMEAVRSHMLSRDIGIMPDGAVIVGGFRSAGRVQPVGEVSALLWKQWFSIGERAPQPAGFVVPLGEALR